MVKMALTNSDRQKRYKEKRKETHTALNLLITNKSFKLLAINATAGKLTKAAYVESLINNEPLVSNANALLSNRNLQQTTFTPHDKEQEQIETIERLQGEVDLLRAHLETAQANIARLEHENKHLLSGTRYKDIPPLGEPS